MILGHREIGLEKLSLDEHQLLPVDLLDLLGESIGSEGVLPHIVGLPDGLRIGNGLLQPENCPRHIRCDSATHFLDHRSLPFGALLLLPITGEQVPNHHGPLPEERRSFDHPKDQKPEQEAQRMVLVGGRD